MSRIAQLAGVALAAGVASYASGYRAGMIVAATCAAAGAAIIAVMLPAPARRRETGAWPSESASCSAAGSARAPACARIDEFNAAFAVGDQFFAAQTAASCG